MNPKQSLEVDFFRWDVYFVALRAKKPPSLENKIKEMHCLRRLDTKELTRLLRHITTEKSGLCQYAVCITQNTTLKK